MVPPRVLVVSPDRALRALVRAELREAGYDAIGASSFAAALEYPPAERERGPVRLLIVHEGAVDPAGEFLERARLQFPGSRFLLVAGEGSGGTVPAGPWDVIARRPVAIGEIVARVRALVPLPPALERPIDT